MTPNEQSVNEALLDALDVQAVSLGLLREYLNDLRELEVALQLEMLGTTVESITDLSLFQLLSRLDAKIDSVMGALASRFEDDAREIAVAEEERQTRALLGIFQVAVAIKSSSVEIVAAPIAGVTIANSMGRLAADLKYRIASGLRREIANGRTMVEASEVLMRGSPGSAPVLNSTVNGLEVLVVTQMKGVADQARVSVVEQAGAQLRERLVYGWQHISVLDNRTSDICWSRAFKVWDADRNPKGHDIPFAMPPLHPRCRSRIAMVDLSQSVVGEFTFRQWAQRQGVAVLSRLFGAQMVARWTTGGITDADLLRSRRGISLEEFKAQSHIWNP